MGDSPADGKAAAGWLAVRIYTVRLHTQVAALTDELVQVSREGWRAVDRVGTDKVYLGVCAALLPPNDVECATRLEVRHGAPVAVCWRCDARYDAAELLAHRDAVIDGSLATAREIADAQFKTPDGRTINARMIEGYARRGTILAHGTRHLPALDRHVPLYLIGEVKDAAFHAKYPKARLTSTDMQASA